MIEVTSKSVFHSPKYGDIKSGQKLKMDEKDAVNFASLGVVEYEKKPAPKVEKETKAESKPKKSKGKND